MSILLQTQGTVEQQGSCVLGKGQNGGVWVSFPHTKTVAFAHRAGASTGYVCPMCSCCCETSRGKSLVFALWWPAWANVYVADNFSIFSHFKNLNLRYWFIFVRVFQKDHSQFYILALEMEPDWTSLMVTLKNTVCELGQSKYSLFSDRNKCLLII